MRNTIAVGEVKKAIVVGATSGIGREIAKRLLAEGYTIGVAGRRTEELERLRALDYDRVFTPFVGLKNYTDIFSSAGERFWVTQ